MTKNTRCPMAYHGISINQDGSLDPCCQYTNNVDPIMYFEYDRFCTTIRDSMNKDFDQGIRHAGCQKCYKEEDLGWTSLRQHTIKWYGLKNYVSTAQKPIYDIELRLGNLCNLKCIMCFPGASSSIATERYQHRNLFRVIELEQNTPWRNVAWWEDEKFLQLIDKLVSQCQRINITGGEPFMIPQVADILDRLMPYADKIELSFNTNLTRLTDEMVLKLSKFNKLTIATSLEGVGDMNNYLRYPSSWDNIQTNINTLKQHLPNASLCVNHTLQHASVYSLPGLVELCYNYNMPLQITTVQGMPWLTLNSVPSVDIEDFIIWVKNNNMLDSTQQNFLMNAGLTASFDKILYNRYRQYVEILDSIRDTHYDNVFNPTVLQGDVSA